MLLGMKEAEQRCETVVVVDARAGRSLSGPDKLARLSPGFLGYTVKGTALLGLTPNAVCAEVRRFCRAGSSMSYLKRRLYSNATYQLRRKYSEKARPGGRALVKAVVRIEGRFT